MSIPPTFYMQGQKLERKIKIIAATSLLPIHHIYFFFVCVPGVIKAGIIRAGSGEKVRNAVKTTI